MKKILFLILTVLLSIHGPVQADDAGNNMPLTTGKRSAIIKKVADIFTRYYPLPDVAAEMTKFIRKKLKKGEYRSFDDLSTFTAQITRDLRSVSSDRHIRISPYEKIPEDLQKEMRLGSPDDNFGFHEVARLTGNIGYIQLNSFNNTKLAGPTAVAAMNFVAHCDALIIDLRLNGGGDTDMAQFLSSYFFDKTTHLSDNHTPKDNKTEQVWTQNWVPGPRLNNIPIYILLSRHSYSSSEDFSYSLQQLGKAVIIGEKTRGGAHGVTYKSFPEVSVNMKIPYTQTINPYSKTNYINGVIPDIPVQQEKALMAANIAAAKKLLETEENQQKRIKLEWVISGYSTDLNPVSVDPETLPEYTGTYQNVIITNECRGLFLKWGSRMKQELVPMGKDLFKYRDPDEFHYRVQFNRDDAGKVISFHWLDSDGDRHPPKEKTPE